MGGALTAPHEEADLARSSRGPVPSLRVLAAPLSLAESLPFSAWLTPRQGCVGVPWRPAGPRAEQQRALAGSCCRTSFLSLAVTSHGVLMHMRHRAFPQRLVVKCLRAALAAPRTPDLQPPLDFAGRATVRHWWLLLCRQLPRIVENFKDMDGTRHSSKTQISNQINTEKTPTQDFPRQRLSFKDVTAFRFQDAQSKYYASRKALSCVRYTVE